MHKVFLSLAQAVFLFVAVCFSVNVAQAQGSYRNQRTKTVAASVDYVANYKLDNAEQTVYSLVNREREKKGLSDLGWNVDLARLARSYSEQMAVEDFFSHYDNAGNSVVERARRMKIRKWRKIGENLFESIGDRNYANASIVMWMKSPTHRQNILDAQWTQTGIGIARSRDGKTYITQIFIED